MRREAKQVRGGVRGRGDHLWAKDQKRHTNEEQEKKREKSGMV